MGGAGLAATVCRDIPGDGDLAGGSELLADLSVALDQLCTLNGRHGGALDDAQGLL